MNSPAAGTKIDDRYELVRPLGEGGMGSVFLALEVELNRMVAIKMLHTSLIADEEHRARFEREGRILSDLDHPNIIKFFRFGVYEQKPYIVMEFLQGRNLSEYLSAGVPAIIESLNLACQIADGLNFAHSKNLVHRDIKPANIFLQQSESGVVVKLVDFGLARVLEPSKLQHLTQTGELIGSVDYMSPEQCMGRAADHRADVYSFGCVLFEMIVGNAPFSADNPIGLMHKHANDAPPTVHDAESLKGVGDPLKKAVGSVVARCLAKNPDERYQTMQDVKDDLLKIIGGRYAELSSASFVAQAPVAEPVGFVKPIAIVSLLLITGTIMFLAFERYRTGSERVNDKLAPRLSTRGLSLHARIGYCFALPSGPERFSQAQSLAYEFENGAAVSSNDIRIIYDMLAAECRHQDQRELFLTHLNIAQKRVATMNNALLVSVLLLEKKCRVQVELRDFPAASETALLGLRVLNESQTSNPGLAGSMLIVLLQSTKEQGLDTYKYTKQALAVLEKVKERRYFDTYAQLANEVAYSLLLHGDYQAETESYDSSIAFLSEAPFALQCEFQRHSIPVARVVYGRDVIASRLDRWLKSINVSTPKDREAQLAERVLLATLLLDNSLTFEAEELLKHMPKDVSGLNSKLQRGYRCCKARVELLKGNFSDAKKEISKILASKLRAGHIPPQELVHVIASCFIAEEVELAARLLELYDSESLSCDSEGNRILIQNYCYLASSASQLASGQQLSLLSRVENMVAKSKNKPPATAFTELALVKSKYLMRKDLREALSLLETALPAGGKEDTSFQQEILSLYATMLLYDDRKEEAADVIQRLFGRAGLDSARAWSLAIAASVYQQAGDLDEAVRYLRFAIKRCTHNPTKNSLKLRLAQTIADAGKVSEAMEVLRSMTPLSAGVLRTYEEATLMQDFHGKFSYYFRRMGRSEEAYRHAEASYLIAKGDRRMDKVRPVFGMIYCLLDDNSKQGTQKRRALIQTARSVNDSLAPRNFSHQIDFLEGRELVLEGKSELGFDKMNRAISACMHQPLLTGRSELLRLAVGVYRDFGKLHEAQECEANFLNAYELSWGKDFVSANAALLKRLLSTKV